MEPQEDPAPEPEDVVGVELAGLIRVDVDSLTELRDVLGPHGGGIAHDDEVEARPAELARGGDQLERSVRAPDRIEKHGPPSRTVPRPEAAARPCRGRRRGPPCQGAGGAATRSGWCAGRNRRPPDGR